MRGKQPYEKIDRDVTRRYAVGKRIGRGCYGVVWEASELTGVRQGRPLALKKVLHAFRDSMDAQRTYREVAYLMEFGQHENILKIHDVLCSADDHHLYVLGDLFDSDLQKALRCQTLKPIHRPYVAYQLLRALKYIHSGGVMHRDVKPSNVLIDSSCKIVLADFGWARTSPAEVGLAESLMTEYASTRWYRPPELLLGARYYTKTIDMWAYGCVVGELHLEKPLIGGTSTIDMLSLIVNMIGKPIQKDIDSLEAPYAAFSLECLPDNPPNKTLVTVFRHDTPELIDFLQLLLQWNPEKRFTAEEAAMHPYLASYADPDSEPIIGKIVNLPLPDEDRFPSGTYRDQIYGDIIGLLHSRRLAEQHRLRMLDEADPLAMTEMLHARRGESSRIQGLIGPGDREAEV
mmetsp:Transcript_18486/g.41842  ORF Transcript_18486/g.41842 Transcript_18486/m.41842 type:complete len:403 (-) Transcript_18486:70-1278(-)